MGEKVKEKAKWANGKLKCIANQDAVDKNPSFLLDDKLYKHTHST